MEFEIKVPGSCGELVQGFYRGEPILITCPIEKFSSAAVSEKFSGIEGLGEKSLLMFEKVLKYFGVKNFDLGLRLTSELPRGKGMSSSSADLSAVAKVLSLALGKNLSAEKISELAAEIEPTDGIFFDGIAAMNPVTGKFIKKFFLPEKFLVAVFDYGGEIDTVKFNRRSDFKIQTLDENLNLELVEKSALANQKILFKPHFEEVINFSKKIGAVTVNVAHSGTVIGIFFHADDLQVAEKISAVKKNFDFLKFLTLTKIIDGGFYGKV